MKLFSALSLQKNFIYLYPLLVGVGVILLSIYVVFPQFQTIVEGREVISAKTTELTNLVNKRQILTSSDTIVLTEQILTIDSALPTEKDVSSILAVIENLSVITGLQINTVALTPGAVSTEAAEVAIPGKPTERIVTKQGVDALAVRVQSKGTTAQFESFLRSIQETRRIIDIESVSVVYSDTEPDVVNADFSLLAFFLPSSLTAEDLLTPLAVVTPDEVKNLELVSKFPDLNTTNSIATQSAEVQIGKSNLFQ